MVMRLGNLGLVLVVTSGIAWAEQESHELGQISVTAGGMPSRWKMRRLPSV